MLDIIIISDIHMGNTLLKKIICKKGDLLIVAGDLTNIGKYHHITSVLNILNQCDFKYKIVVFGNHDIAAEYDINYLKLEFPDIIFLNNEIVEIEGYKIYGTPYVRACANWGFQYYSNEERKKRTIPNEAVDVIISHEPPSDPVLSWCPYLFNEAYMVDIGNEDLRQYIIDNPSVKLVVSGHVHENGGSDTVIGNARVYNTAGKIRRIEL